MSDHCPFHRRSIRLKGFDYSQPGAYFVTITTWQGEWIFGDIVEDEMRLNPIGELAARNLISLQKFFPIHVEPWIVMPNHVHAIIYLEAPAADQGIRENSSQGRSRRADALPNGTANGSLGAIIQNYKSVSSRQINQLRATQGQPVWHRNYFERIIRNEKEYRLIYAYIEENPRNWLKDPKKLRNW